MSPAPKAKHRKANRAKTAKAKARKRTAATAKAAKKQPARTKGRGARPARAPARRRALLSVSDKQGLAEFAAGLIEL
ncbi:MAG TPA: hypothetical protein VFJ95_11835, partial [Gammaproteobacteria bacterium]|nr:hypothetical protein [Gammaproteobacteria bacterium]